MTETVEAIRKKTGFIIDMDGVLYHGNRKECILCR